MLGFWIPHGKIANLYFFLVRIIPLSELCPFEKIRMKFVSKISRKVFELGFETWSVDRGWWVDYLINFWMNSVIFPELWPFENLGILNLSARYLENYLSLGLQTWPADRGLRVDYLITSEKILSNFSGVIALWKLGHFKLVSKISRKVFALGAWNLVS